MLAVITPEQRAVRFQTAATKAAAVIAERAEKLMVDVLQNLPDYAQYKWITCPDWDYGMDEKLERQLKPAVYTFNVSDPDGDCEEFSEHKVSPSDFAMVVPELWMAVMGKIVFPGGKDWTTCDFWDPCNWDADVLDCLLQYYFYGDLVYG